MSLKGSSDLLFQNYFSEIDDGHDFYAGQICDAHVQYPMNLIHVLDPVQIDARDDKNSTFKIKHYRPNEVIPPHMPLPQLHLESDEYFYISRGKRRPVIVLCGITNNHWTKTINQEEKVYLCAPIFSLKERHTRQDAFAMQAFVYNNIFYLPPQDPLEEESVVRFELIQPVMGSSLQRKKNIGNQFSGLSSDVFPAFANHLAKFLTGECLDKNVDDFCKEYGQIILDSLSKIPAAQKTAEVK